MLSRPSGRLPLLTAVPARLGAGEGVGVLGSAGHCHARQQLPPTRAQKAYKGPYAAALAARQQKRNFGGLSCFKCLPARLMAAAFAAGLG